MVFRPPHGDECPVCREEWRRYLREHPELLRASLWSLLRWIGATVLVIVLIMLASDVAGAQGGGEVQTVIYDAASRHGLPASKLLCIAERESGFRPWVTSWDGRYFGTWQFSRRTWQWASTQAGYPGASPFDLWVSTEVAAWLMSTPGGFSHWSTSRGCW